MLVDRVHILYNPNVSSILSKFCHFAPLTHTKKKKKKLLITNIRETLPWLNQTGDYL